MDYSKAELLEAFNYADLANMSKAFQKSRYGNPLTRFDLDLGPILKLLKPGAENLGITCYTLNQGHRVIVGFGGSDDILDWLANIMAGTNKHGCHIGFDLMLDQIKAKILKTLDWLQPKSLYFVGHSAGGAFAQLFAQLYGGQFNCNIEVFTFGAPRIGTTKFHRKFPLKNEPVRVDNGADLVCHMPPSFLGFRHYGDAVHVGRKPSNYEKLVMTVRAWRSRNGGKLPWFRDHARSEYKKSLGAL